MTLKEKILVELKNGPMSDRELADKLLGVRAPQQSINQMCRQLSEKGFITRTAPPIKNIYAKAEYTPPLAKIEHTPPEEQIESAPPLSEEAIKKILNDHLMEQGWQTEVAWGGTHGIDIDARRSPERWIIEVKGSGSLNPMRVNYFLGILGELLQRMDEPTARYSIALPDLQQFRNLWSRLPDLAKQRTTIDAIFVSGDGTIDFVK